MTRYTEAVCGALDVWYLLPDRCGAKTGDGGTVGVSSVADSLHQPRGPQMLPNDAVAGFCCPLSADVWWGDHHTTSASSGMVFFIAATVQCQRPHDPKVEEKVGNSECAEAPSEALGVRVFEIRVFKPSASVIYL